MLVLHTSLKIVFVTVNTHSYMWLNDGHARDALCIRHQRLRSRSLRRAVTTCYYFAVMYLIYHKKSNRMTVVPINRIPIGIAHKTRLIESRQNTSFQQWIVIWCLNINCAWFLAKLINIWQLGWWSDDNLYYLTPRLSEIYLSFN